jgi:heat shock protein HslJ
MACADESVMEQEQAYFAALQTTGHFEIQDDRLIITYDEGRSALTFEKVANAYL